MAKKTETPKAKESPGGRKRSRTLYMSDADWQVLSALAESEGRTRTAQIMHMVKKEVGNS